jgi:hypothetical protein
LRILPALVLAAALPAAAQDINDPRDAKTQGRSEWELREEERSFKEGEVRLPAAPKADKLIEFQPTAATSFRFFVDPDSLSVEGGVVRYTLVARSPSGYENVSYEGMRCKANSVRVYAYAHGGAWARARSDWKPIEPRGVQRWHNELRSRYFCPIGVSIMDRDEGLSALRRGGHPLARGTGETERH